MFNIKKYMVAFFVSIVFVFGSTLNLNLSDTFNSNTPWNISFAKDKTYYLMLPVDISYSQIQNSISDDQIIWVYRWYQRSDLVNADFGINVLGLVKITKTNITYYIQDNGNWIAKSNYSDMKSYLNNKANDISDSSKKLIFVNSYIKKFDKIRANSLYLIMSNNANFAFNISMNANQNSGLETPPSPPGMDNNDTNGSEALIMPPTVPGAYNQ